jgi:hypothetical protein
VHKEERPLVIENEQREALGYSGSAQCSSLSLEQSERRGEPHYPHDLYCTAGATGPVGPVLAGPIFWQESGCAYFINQRLIEHARLK